MNKAQFIEKYGNKAVLVKNASDFKKFDTAVQSIVGEALPCGHSNEKYYAFNASTRKVTWDNIVSIRLAGNIVDVSSGIVYYDPSDILEEEKVVAAAFKKGDFVINKDSPSSCFLVAKVECGVPFDAHGRDLKALASWPGELLIAPEGVPLVADNVVEGFDLGTHAPADTKIIIFEGDVCAHFVKEFVKESNKFVTYGGLSNVHAFLAKPDTKVAGAELEGITKAGKQFLARKPHKEGAYSYLFNKGEKVVTKSGKTVTLTGYTHACGNVAYLINGSSWETVRDHDIDRIVSEDTPPAEALVASKDVATVRVTSRDISVDGPFIVKKGTPVLTYEEMLPWMVGEFKSYMRSAPEDRLGDYVLSPIYRIGYVPDERSPYTKRPWRLFETEVVEIPVSEVNPLFLNMKRVALANGPRIQYVLARTSGMWGSIPAGTLLLDQQDILPFAVGVFSGYAKLKSGIYVLFKHNGVLRPWVFSDSESVVERFVEKSVASAHSLISLAFSATPEADAPKPVAKTASAPKSDPSVNYTRKEFVRKFSKSETYRIHVTNAAEFATLVKELKAYEYGYPTPSYDVAKVNAYGVVVYIHNGRWNGWDYGNSVSDAMSYPRVIEYLSAARR